MIDGTGATVTVSGNNAVRIFDVIDGTTTLTVKSLALVNGFAGAAGQRGGAIATTGALVVDTVTFGANRADDGGGAIFVGRLSGTLGRATILNSTFSGNRVTGAGAVGGGAISSPAIRACRRWRRCNCKTARSPAISQT